MPVRLQTKRTPFNPGDPVRVTSDEYREMEGMTGVVIDVHGMQVQVRTDRHIETWVPGPYWFDADCLEAIR